MQFRLAFTVGDYEASRAFYGDVLGLRITNEWDNGVGDRGTIYQSLTDGCFELFAPASGVVVADRGTDITVSIEVADPDALYATFVGRGAPVVAAPQDQQWGHRNFTVRDPDGLRITFFARLG